MKFKKSTGLFIFSIALLILLNFIQLPYYVTKPGMATELKPMIEVENGYNEEGSFSLTTVQIGRANPFTYLWANTQKYYEVFPLDHVKYEGESDQDYIERQIQMMEASQESAIEIAFKKANKPIEVQYFGVIVISVIADMPSYGKLQVGDIITHVDGMQMKTAEEFIQYVSSKNKGEEVSISLKRDGKEKTLKIQLDTFPNEPNKVGIGISLITNRELMTTPSVTLDTEDIGGPSAGLMMALEVYNQLTEEDLTKGYKIAGTGTINEKGEIGPIGGIAQKVVAADEEGIDIFLAPNEMGAQNSNFREAVKTAKDIHSDMIIVPVDTFDDAVKFLNELEAPQ